MRGAVFPSPHRFLNGPLPIFSAASIPARISVSAKLVTSVDDVLDELNLPLVVSQTAVQLALPESAEEAAIMPHLSRQPLHIDELSRASGLPSSMVSSTLTMMELKGMVQQVGGMRYVIAREANGRYDVGTQKSE